MVYLIKFSCLCPVNSSQRHFQHINQSHKIIVVSFLFIPPFLLHKEWVRIFKLSTQFVYILLNFMTLMSFFFFSRKSFSWLENQFGCWISTHRTISNIFDTINLKLDGKKINSVSLTTIMYTVYIYTHLKTFVFLVGIVDRHENINC